MKILTFAKDLLRLQKQAAQARLAQFEANLLQDPRRQDLKTLSRFERRVFSQFGEDGVVAEIFRRVGAPSRTFVELGVGDGLENNTTFLLLQGWRGGWIDGDAANIRRIRRRFCGPIGEGRLTVQRAFVTAENVGGLLEEMKTPAAPDLLSLDIDRNTYWVWAALARWKPRVVVVEYNAGFPPEFDWKVDYDPARGWNGTAYFGASLKAYELLGRKLGYALVGCTLSGVNAFFVREELAADKFSAPFTAEHHHEPPRYFLRRRDSHAPCFDDRA